MPYLIPTPTAQLKFLKQIQQILQYGSFTSTYKFALLISLARLAIENGQDTGEPLTLDYHDIAEKFIQLYWQQVLPIQFNINGNQKSLILQQNSGQQAAIINAIDNAKQKYKTLAALRSQTKEWQNLNKHIAGIIKRMPAQYLQNINKQNFEFLYHYDSSDSQLILLPQVMYCLRQFSEIIEELCQKRWIDYIRQNKTNIETLGDLPNLEHFMFASTRNQLTNVSHFLFDLQEAKCFYCQKTFKKNHMAVDHFIPWSLYPSDTGHNFVLADSKCNSQKSNFLASAQFVRDWITRNNTHNATITHELTTMGFLGNQDRTQHIAHWAYQQAIQNQYILWDGIGNDKIVAGAANLQPLIDGYLAQSQQAK